VKIETERLELRTATMDDAARLLQLFTIPEVLRYTPPGPPWTIEKAQRSVERRIQSDREFGYSVMIVRDKATGEFLGNAGLQRIPDTPEIEMGYHYLPSAWGKGYGTEAAIAILGHGLRTVGLDRVIAICVPANIGSWRIMEKAGMRPEGYASYYGLEGLKKYAAERADWRPPTARP
jgi:RimJ/RimL family protein N-acetyltransferase